MSDETNRPPLPLNDVIMSEDDAAALIGVQPETMKRMRRHGEGPPHFAVSGHVFRKPIGSPSMTPLRSAE